MPGGNVGPIVELAGRGRSIYPAAVSQKLLALTRADAMALRGTARSARAGLLELQSV